MNIILNIFRSTYAKSKSNPHIFKVIRFKFVKLAQFVFFDSLESDSALVLEPAYDLQVTRYGY